MEKQGKVRIITTLCPRCGNTTVLGGYCRTKDCGYKNHAYFAFKEWAQKSKGMRQVPGIRDCKCARWIMEKFAQFRIYGTFNLSGAEEIFNQEGGAVVCKTCGEGFALVLEGNEDEQSRK